MSIPNDPVMLLSFVNTQLRDNYSSLAEFVRAYDEDEETIISKLEGIGYTYNSEQNRFM
ncbi:MAG: DUF4250 domain-containing protein [Clostridia bacterium]|nr:DUF4250 domain-containing protein [Clostridia bacterium]